MYQILINPLFNKPHCRFQITCSQYGIQTIKKFGALKGIGKILIRILKCHPFRIKLKK